jgi:hypothetical protein
MTSKVPTANQDPDHAEVGHETRDVNPWGIVSFGGALVVGAIVIFLVVWVLFGYFGGLYTGRYPAAYPLAPTTGLRLPPAPRLQTKPREDLKAFRREEDARLNQYGWADENAGLARIPVDEAMQRVLQHGLPSAPPSPDAGAAGERPTRSSSGRSLQEGQQP